MITTNTATHATAKVTSKGQITIPITIRKHMKINKHDSVKFSITSTGCVIIKPVKHLSIDALKGAAGKLSKPLKWSDVRSIAQEDALS